MQKIALGILGSILLAASFGFASVLESEVQSFSQKLSSVKKDGQCSACRFNSHDKSSAQNLKQSAQCVQDICAPSAKEAKRLLPTAKEGSKIWQDPRLRESILLFKKALQTEEQARLAATKKAAEFMSNPNYKYSKEVIEADANVVAKWIASSLFKDRKDQVGPDGRAQVPLASEIDLRAEWGKYGISKQEGDLLFKAFREDKYAQLNAMPGSGAAFSYDFLYPAKPFQIAIRDDIEEAKVALQSFPQTAAARGLKLTPEAAESIFFMADGDRYIDDQLGNSILEQIRTIHFQSRLMKDPKLKAVVEKITRGVLESDQKNHAKTVKVMSSDKPTDFSDLDKPRELYVNSSPLSLKSSPLATIFGACYGNVAYALLAFPTRDELQKAKPAIEGVRDQVLKGLSQTLSPETFQCLQGPLSKVRPAFPPTQDEYLKAFNTILNAKIADSEAMLKSVKADTNGDFSVAYSLRSDVDGFPHPFDLYARCHDLGIRPISDHTEFGFNVIAISSEGVKNTEFGVDVAAHEIGHLVSSLMQSSKCISAQSREKYQVAKACLAHMQPAANEKAPSHFEEDFADLISAKTSSSKKNIWCELFRGNDAKAEGALNLAAFPGDPHSSKFLRLLHTQKVKFGSLPKSCSDSLPMPTYNVEKCL
jgi:hypothetical protein